MPRKSSASWRTRLSEKCSRSGRPRSASTKESSKRHTRARMLSSRKSKNQKRTYRSSKGGSEKWRGSIAWSKRSSKISKSTRRSNWKSLMIKGFQGQRTHNKRLMTSRPRTGARMLSLNVSTNSSKSVKIFLRGLMPCSDHHQQTMSPPLRFLRQPSLITRQQICAMNSSAMKSKRLRSNWPRWQKSKRRRCSSRK